MQCPLVSRLEILVQCDFDGTITEQDVSFFLLDAFAQGDWRELLRDYRAHRISVGEFNTRSFAMVKADEHMLLKAMKGRVKTRAGFHELVSYCQQRDFRLVIVSNGMEFYIRAVLNDLGLPNIEAHAARASFRPKGMEVEYMGPDGKKLEDGFKEAYVESFLRLGYRVIYIGNGDSDFAPARYADRVIATGDLLAHCKESNLECESFETFLEVVRKLELL